MFQRRKIVNDLTQLLENSTPTVREVLESPALGNTVLNECPELFNFILPTPEDSKDRLDEFLDWALTTYNYKSPDDFRLMHNAGRIFSSPWRNLHMKLKEDGRLARRFENFYYTKFADDPLIAGNFNGMLKNHINMTQGTFLEGKRRLHRELFKRIHINAYKDLVYNLISDYHEIWGAQFSSGIEFIIVSMLKIAKNNLNLPTETDKERRSVFNVFSIITNIIQMSTDYRKIFLTADVIDAMIDTALLCRDKLNINNAFHALHSILQPMNTLPAEILDVIERRGGDFKFGDDDRSRAAFPVFYKHGLKPMMSVFFAREYPQFSAAYVSAIGLLNEQELDDLLNDNRLINLLIDEFKGNKVPTNGCVIELAWKLISPDLPLKVHKPYEKTWMMNSAEWYSVVHRVLDLRAKLDRMKLHE